MFGPLCRRVHACLCLAAVLVLAACNNSPYPDGAAASNTVFNSFDERSPRTLDPTASYSNPETPYTFAAYEPLYGYQALVQAALDVARGISAPPVTGADALHGLRAVFGLYRAAETGRVQKLL